MFSSAKNVKQCCYLCRTHLSSFIIHKINKYHPTDVRNYYRSSYFTLNAILFFFFFVCFSSTCVSHWKSMRALFRIISWINFLARFYKVDAIYKVIITIFKHNYSNFIFCCFFFFTKRLTDTHWPKIRKAGNTVYVIEIFLFFFSFFFSPKLNVVTHNKD